MPKPTLVYDLGALVVDDLRPAAGELAEALVREPGEIDAALAPSLPRYIRGEISQNDHWEDAAAALGLEDVELFGAFAIKFARVDEALLGRLRGQHGRVTLGLVSDATPDWVGHWRKTWSLDRLVAAPVISFEHAERRPYVDLLKTAQGRLGNPETLTLVDRKAAHWEAARGVGFGVIEIRSDTDYATAFAGIG
jgi:FMN phosphatase YigB (HAD superfamily)